MFSPIIKVENLGKKYRIGGTIERYQTLRDTIMRIPKTLVRCLHGRHAYQDETIWVLKNVSFEVRKGEVVGIIGRNGAGKTTLLRILSRITEPTEGRVELRGRVGSLLEVGTGFHPELTGRENIFLNGAILGMKRTEIKKKFDEIVAFAEIEKFIDTPVKRYSSGMYVRLAFAVAAHLEPEILLVDEVLAVGDAAFQKKCLGKMGDVAKEGRTVMFVSHNMVAVQSLCERVIWLNDGKIVEEGESIQVVASYLQTTAIASIRTEKVWDDIATAPGNDMVRLHRVCVRPENGSTPDLITVRTPFVIEIEFWNLVPDARLNPNFHLITVQRIIAFASAPVPLTDPIWCGRSFPVGLFRSICHIPGDLLNTGMHHVQLFFGKDGRIIIYQYEDVLSFEVRDSPERRGVSYGKVAGVVWPFLKWTTELLKAGAEFTLSVQGNEINDESRE